MSIDNCKRILAIHDLSGFGHTSLLAEIAIMYRLGIRVCALPTAILSANTDYEHPHWVDMSAQLDGFVQHWSELGLHFNAIHSGFLSSAAQAEQIGRAIDILRSPDTHVLVDPVMADNGALYDCFSAEIVPAMRGLISKADVITPNFTEAALLAGDEVSLSNNPSRVLEWCRDISRMGPRRIIITSVPADDSEQLQVLFYDATSDETQLFPFTRVKGTFPGAGDCFSSFLLAGIVNGYDYPASIKAGVETMADAIKAGIPDTADWREGIALERVLSGNPLARYLK